MIRLPHLGILAFAASALFFGGCIFGGGDADLEVSGTPEATGSATGGATSEPTVAATAPGTPRAVELPPGLEATADGTWERRSGMVSGDDVPDVLGAFVFDTRSGDGTLWSLAPGAVEDPEFVLVRTSANANYVVAEAKPSHLVNTESGESWSWGFRSRLLLIDDRGLALFAGTGTDDCLFWVADLAGGAPRPLSSFRIGDEPRCGGVSAWFSPDGSSLLFAIQPGSVGGVEVMTVDLASGATSLVGVGPNLSVRLTPHGEQSVTLSAGGSGSVWLGTYTWADERFATTRIDARRPGGSTDGVVHWPSGVTVSPDGRWVAWSESEDLGIGDGAGGLAEFPVTVLTSTDGRGPLLRAQRVARTNGTVSFGWVADSSALVVQSQDGFALFRTDGSLWDLPFAIALHTDPVPIPAPDKADRFVYGGLVVDVPGDANVEIPAVADEWARQSPTGGPSWWIRTRYGWGADAPRLIFVRTEILGGDYGRGGIASLGLPARVTGGPAPAHGTSIALRVNSDGDRLNVRAAPGIDSALRGQFDDATLVTIGRDRSVETCGPDGCSILTDPVLDYDERWWIYVTGAGPEGDLAGWVSSEFLEWAP